MSVVLSVAKGRASAWPLLAVCRHFAAIALSSSAPIHVRWDASEGNPADEPSQRFQPKRGAAASLGWRCTPLTSTSRATSLQARAAARRREQRRAAFSQLGLAERSLLDHLGFSALERDSVRAATQKDYLQGLVALAVWMGSTTLPTLLAEEWEEILLEWFEEVFMSGKAITMGAKTVSALLWAFPRLGRPPPRVLPHVSRAYRGWKCRSPGRSWPPIPWIVVCVASAGASWAGSSGT